MFSKSLLFEAALHPENIKEAKYYINENSFTVIKETSNIAKLKLATPTRIFYIDLLENECKFVTNYQEELEAELESFFELELLGILKINFEYLKDKNNLYKKLITYENTKLLKDIKERVLLSITDINEIYLDKELEKLLTFLGE